MGEQAIQEDQELDQELDTADIPEGEETAEDEEFGTIVLEGEEEQPSEDDSPPPKQRDTSLVRNLRKQLKQRGKDLRSSSRENDALLKRINDLEARLEQQQQAPGGQQTAQPGQAQPRPRLEDFNYDVERFQQATDEWIESNIDSRIDQRLSSRDQATQTAQRTQAATAAIDAHYDRAARLKVEGYADAEIAVSEVLGDELVQSIQANLDNSEQVIFYLGKNPQELDRLNDLFKSSGAKGTVELGRLSGKVNFKPTGRRAPDPDMGVPGGGGAASPQQAKLQRELEAVTKKGGPDVIEKRREIFRKAEAAGVTLQRS